MRHALLVLLAVLLVGCGVPAEPRSQAAGKFEGDYVSVGGEQYYVYRVPFEGGTVVVLDNAMEGPRSSMAVFIPSGAAPKEEPAPKPTPVEVP